MTNQFINITMDKPIDKTKEVAIIGGGLAGLTAAVYISRNGKNVTIIEKSSEFGGRARTTMKDGFYFNQGPHALYADGLGSRILNELNVIYNGKKVDYTKYFVKDKEKIHQSPIKLSQFLATKLLKGLRGKIEIIRFLVKLNKMNLDGLQRISFQEWLDKSFKNSDSKDFVKMLGRISTYTYNAENLSAKLALNQIKTAVAGGVIYIDEGWQTLVDQLTDIAKRNGVKFVYGKNVDFIAQSYDNNGPNRQLKWKIRLSNNTAISYYNVIIATNPSHVYSLLKDNALVNPEFLSQLEKMNRPARVATLDIALSGLPNPNVYGAYGMDVPLYLSLHSEFAKLSVDGNGVLFHAIKYLDSSTEPNPIQDKMELEGLLDMVQPGWRKMVVRQRFLPNMIASNTFLNNNKGFMENRPNMEVPGVDNLYIIGDWVGPDGMLADTSFASAKAVALKILSENKEIEIHDGKL
ncbi:MAG TPA: oleate hydratase [Nitrososphaeraceae archaeon]|nr:oleate hydratase [Nitrososphaeraceae archaeon]